MNKEEFKEKMNQKTCPPRTKMDPLVVESFAQLLCMPLGADTEKEYMEMKGYLFSCLESIAKAGNLEEELEAGFGKLIERMHSPEFLSLLLKQKVKDVQS